MSAQQTNLVSNLPAARDSSPTSVVSHKESARQLAPIALFVYNRPEHTRRTVESLRANTLAPQSDLFVFSDAARKESAAAAVEDVRKFIRTIEGFKSVTIIERERNFGLAASVIAGTTQLCEEFGRLIAVEDDLLTSADFLSFMNCALHRYADDSRIYSVSGFNFSFNAPKDYQYDVYCSYRSMSWGWGTWKDRWEKADWNVSDYLSFSADKNQQRQFNRGGEDLSHILDLQMAGQLDSWSIRWDYTHFKRDALAVLPVVSRVSNTGSDGSGVHCRHATLEQPVLSSAGQTDYRFPHIVEADRFFVGEIQRLHRRSAARKLMQYLKSKMGRR
jgi:glycosyltransferase involved in cell wall biosynthesis